MMNPARTKQLDIFETNATKSLLDQPIVDSHLYTLNKDYKDLLDFVVRLRKFCAIQFYDAARPKRGA